MEIVDVAEDRHQLLDGRGRFVAGYATRQEAEAFLAGYKAGRDDAATVAQHAVEGLPQRIASRSA